MRHTINGEPMKILFMLTALLPFFHYQKYPVNLKSCNNDQILIEYNQEQYSLELFNLVETNEQSRAQVCRLLNEASEIQIEIDPLIQISEPIKAYVFVDGTLLQKQMIQMELALPKINHPHYKYHSQMQVAIKTAYHDTKNKTMNQDYHGLIHLGIYYLILLLCICIYRKIRV